jgi:outer membrane biosynthesis protein TonB
MSPSSPPSPSMRAPAGLPPSGNSKYIAIFVILVLGTLGVVALKMRGDTPPVASPVRPTSTFDAAPVSHAEDNVPLPPPPEEPVPDAGPTNRVTSTFDPCAVKTCTGTTTPDLETQLGFRAKQAHRCYDQALAQDSDLKGHVVLDVKIGSNGSVCAANVKENDMGTDSVANCVLQIFRSTRSFPAPKGNCANVEVPISFVAGRH